MACELSATDLIAIADSVKEARKSGWINAKEETRLLDELKQDCMGVEEEEEEEGFDWDDDEYDEDEDSDDD